MSQNESHPEIPYRLLGGTGEKLSAIGIGGFHLVRGSFIPIHAAER